MISYENKLRAFIKSTRKIQTGEEIYISYGFHYWKEYYELVHAADKVTIGWFAYIYDTFLAVYRCGSLIIISWAGSSP